jgi:metal-responsive CopG/Arc/MetJ family transcriptional regulator
MKKNKKTHHIRLRVDDTLQEMMTTVISSKQIKNRSQFIRDSILAHLCREKLG